VEARVKKEKTKSKQLDAVYSMSHFGRTSSIAQGFGLGSVSVVNEAFSHAPCTATL